MEIIAEQARERIVVPKRNIMREAVARIVARLHAFTPQNYLAFFFVFMIFFVGAKTIPATLTNTANILKAPNADELKKQVTAFSNAYSGMLEFKGGPLLHKGAYINVNGWMARAMGQRRMNGVIKLANGQLTTLVGKTSEDIMKKAVASVVAVHRMQVMHGNYYVFVITTQKLDRDNAGLPTGEVDYRNANLDELKRRLIQNSVPVLDLRDEWEKDGLNFDTLFSPTDHHWTAETGFWAYAKIVEFLEDRGVIPLVSTRYVDLKNYNIETYSGLSLGSQGKRTGTLFAGVDDATLIYPKYFTETVRSIPFNNDIKQGSFKDAFARSVNNNNNYFTSVYDNLYIGNRAWPSMEMTNSLAPLDIKILSYGDSMNNFIAPLMSLISKNSARLGLMSYEINLFDFSDEYRPNIIYQTCLCFEADFNLEDFAKLE